MNVSVELSARKDVPRWLAVGTPVFTVLGALALSAVALVALSVDPIAAYNTMFVETLTDPFGLRQTATRTVPLVLTGLAVYLPLRAGLWNVGAEGQLYMGAIAGTWIGLNVSLPMVALIPLAVLGAAVAGGLWAGIPGYLKAKWDVNEIITTLLLTFVATQIASYLVRGPMQGGSGNFPGSDLLPDAAQFPAIPLLDVHAGFLVGLLAVAATAVLLARTRAGFEVTFVGSNPLAGVQAGMSTFRVYLFVFLVGGAFAGIAGFNEISGVQERLIPEFSPGYGFTAIPIALLGRNGAVRVLLAAAFFALLFVGGSKLEVAYGVPAALVDVIQALVILFLITAEFVKRYRVDVELGREPAAGPAGEA
ncbi:ABC transporter permease [Halosimplex salinum]|uniref:ABC transporter permease n=1 Tax=Halosimplex salinum TaxID=1710538 RepID=UPI000F4ADE32|nr:ABC transporter permease [Halosimplex salinum]